MYSLMEAYSRLCTVLCWNVKVEKKSVWLKFRFSFVLAPVLKIFSFLTWHWDLIDFINITFLLFLCVCGITEGGTRRSHSSLEGTPIYERQLSGDSPHSLNADSFSMTSSIMSGSIDHLSTGSPDQESMFSMESHTILQEDNGSETFSVLQSPESANVLINEENGDVLDLQKLPNSDSGMGTSAIIDTLTSASPLMLTEDLTSSVGDECNGGVVSASNECCPGKLSQEEEEQDFPTLCKIDEDLDKMKLQNTEKSSEHPDLTEQMFLECDSILGVQTSLTPKENDETGGEDQKQLSLIHSALSDPSAFQRDISDNVHSDNCSISGWNFGSAIKAKCSTSTAERVADSYESKTEKSASSDEEDIYGHGLPYSSSETSMPEVGAVPGAQDVAKISLDEMVLSKSDQVFLFSLIKVPSTLKGNSFSRETILQLLSFTSLGEQFFFYLIQYTSKV